MKAHEVSNEIKIDNNDRYDDEGNIIQPLVSRDLTQAEIDGGILQYAKKTENGNDIEVDTEKRDADIADIKTAKIKENKNLILAELKELDHKLLSDYSFPNDVQTWIDHRASLKSDIASLGNLTQLELDNYSLRDRPNF